MKENDCRAPDRVECPHCGRDVPAENECRACGVVFSKYHSIAPRPRDSFFEMSTRPPAPPTDTRSSKMTSLLVMLAIALSTFVANELRTEPEPVTAGVPTSPPKARAESRLVKSPSRRAPSQPSTVAFVTEDAPRPTHRSASSAEPEERRPRATTPSYDWHEGADGMSRGIREAQEENRAIAVYFYTDWCGYCRQLESEILERAKVEGYMKYMTRIRINPEESANARFIAERYGVTGFPAFFVHPAADQGPTKVGRMKRHNGEWRLKTPDEFIESIRRIVDG